LRDTEISAALLAWYDLHARDLPWRIGPAARLAGIRPDPYRVWLSEVMLQQTTVPVVGAYFARFTTTWPEVRALAAAEDGEVMAAWAGLGYYARARNLLACARDVARLPDARFPDTVEGLRALRGIGPYTAAAIAAIAFDRAETVVDGNVERVVARLFAVETPLPGAKRELTALASRLTPDLRPGCHAQAMMDLGATICTPRAPSCGRCPLRAGCAAHAAGLAAALPRKMPKAAKPLRHGTVFVGQRVDGAWLVERRPPRGLLGGMLGWPGSDWAEEAGPAAPPCAADWQDTGGEVRHTFTHFHLRLRVLAALLPAGAAPERGHYVDAADFDVQDMPALMRKAHGLGAAHLRQLGR